MSATPAAIAADPLRWDLSDLYRADDDPRLQSDLDEAKARVTALGAHRGRVAGLDGAGLAALLADYEALLVVAWRPSLYASLRFSAATDDTAAQALLARTREAAAHVSTAARFLDVEVKTAPQPVFDAWLAAPELAEFRHFLGVARRQAPHTLSEAEEKIDTLKSLT